MIKHPKVGQRDLIESILIKHQPQYSYLEFYNDERFPEMPRSDSHRGTRDKLSAI